MALVLDGNGTMTVGNGDITGLVAGALPSTVIGAGAVLQVKQGIFYAAGISSTSSTFIDTGLSATITPTSATSKILIFVSATAGIANHLDSYYFTIFRDSTNLNYGYSGTPAMARQYQQSASNLASDGFQINLNYLDSPATTSSITYSVRIKNDGNGSTMYFGRITSSADSHGGIINLMEIAA